MGSYQVLHREDGDGDDGDGDDDDNDHNDVDDDPPAEPDGLVPLSPALEHGSTARTYSHLQIRFHL